MPSSALRTQLLGRVRRLVVKVGSQILSDPTPGGGVDVAAMRSIAAQIAALVKRGCDVTLVSRAAASCRSMARQG